jgi:hypothetical protein
LEKSNCEFEIRLTIDTQLSLADNFVWIKKYHGQWLTQSFSYVTDYTDNSFEIQKTSEEKMSIKWSADIQSFLNDNFSNLVDQKEVVHKLMTAHKTQGGEDAWFLVRDGTNYYLTIKMQDRAKSLTLHSPWSYAMEFPDSKELKLYCDFLDLIDKNVKVKVRD